MPRPNEITEQAGRTGWRLPPRGPGDCPAGEPQLLAGQCTGRHAQLHVRLAAVRRKARQFTPKEGRQAWLVLHGRMQLYPGSRT
jgi:hypothetical protein